MTPYTSSPTTIPIPVQRNRITRAPLVAGSILALLLLAWLGAKISLFHGLSYTSDLFHLVQSAYSYLLGRPLLFNNDFGSGGAAHNYFLLPLLGPFAYGGGAHAFFIITAALFALAGYCGLKTISQDSEGSFAWGRQAIFLGLLCGPVAFWIWDDPIYGWHPEIFYIPLSCLFALDLRHHLKRAWLWGILMALNKEDGAAMACSVQLLVLACASDGRMLPVSQRLGNIAKTICLWLVVFGAGIFILQVWSDSGNARLTASLQQLFIGDKNGQLYTLLLSQLEGVGMLWLAGAIYLFREHPSRWLTLILCSLPLLMVNLVSCLAYVDDLQSMQAHGLLWPARCALLWALLVCSVPVYTGIRQDKAPSRGKLLWLVGASICSLVLQYQFLLSWRGYSAFDRYRAALGTPRSALPINSLARDERRFLHCLAKKLDRRVPLAVHPMLFMYFHQHDFVGVGRHSNAWLPYQVVICEQKGRLQFGNGCAELLDAARQRGDDRAQVRGIEVRYRPELKNSIDVCLPPQISDTSQRTHEVPKERPSQTQTG